MSVCLRKLSKLLFPSFGEGEWSWRMVIYGREQKSNWEHQTLILFYWHHDSLNLFINFGSARNGHVVCPSTHSPIGGKRQRRRRFVTFFFVSLSFVLWPEKLKQNNNRKAVHKKTSTSHQPWTVADSEYIGGVKRGGDICEILRPEMKPKNIPKRLYSACLGFWEFFECASLFFCSFDARFTMCNKMKKSTQKENWK